MDRKIKVHLSLFAVLVVVTTILYYVNTSQKEKDPNIIEDEYSMLHNYNKESKELISSIKSTAIPLTITILYGCFLTYRYAFPYFAERMSDGVYEPHNLESDDLRFAAEKEITDGEYTQAIDNYTELIKRDSADIDSVMAIAHIRRDHLKKPRQAIDALQKTIDSRDWSEENKTRMLSFIAEVYEIDFSDHPKAMKILQDIVSQYPDSRYAANASSKIRAFDKITPKDVPRPR